MPSAKKDNTCIGYGICGTLIQRKGIKAREDKSMEILLLMGGGLLIIIVAVIVAVVSSISSSNIVGDDGVKE